MSRHLTAKINLAAIEQNFKLAQSLNGNSPVAIIKSNAYGCGAVAVAKKLQPNVEIFGVASLEEAIQLRENDIQTPILLLEGFFEKTEIAEIAKYQLLSAIHSDWQLQYLQEAKPKTQLPIWLKTNTGMNRLGFKPEKIVEIAKKPTGAYAPKALMTHFASADATDATRCKTAFSKINQLSQMLNLPVSASNSAAILAHNFGDFYPRPGIMLYGISPFEEENPVAKKLKPAITLESKIIAIQNLQTGDSVGYGESFTAKKPMRIAIIAGGYGDGISREHYKAAIFINGSACKIVGRISMDMLSVDISHLPTAKIGDRTEFWGNEQSISEVAKQNSTISYTLTTQLLPRVHRIYTS